jgi:hypothetical protein
VQQFQDYMAKMPNLDAFVPTGGFPQFIPDANRAAVEPHKVLSLDSQPSSGMPAEVYSAS